MKRKLIIFAIVTLASALLPILAFEWILTAGAATTQPTSVRVTNSDGTYQDFALVPTTVPTPETEPPATRPHVARMLGIQPPTISDGSGGGASEFINLVWRSRGFRPPGTPFAYEGGPALDEAGNPTGDFGLRLITDGKEGRKGTYTFNARGKLPTASSANRGNTVRDVTYDAASEKITAKIDVAKFEVFELVVTGTTGGLRDVEVLAPGYVSSERIFTNELRETFRAFGLVRWMGAQGTNEEAKNKNTVAIRTWSQVAGRGAPHWPNGVPPWVCLEYGVQEDRPVWICVPAEADDDFVIKLGEDIRARGPRAPPVYVEYSNEVWNPTYKAYKQNKARASAATQPTATPIERTLVAADGARPNLEYAAQRRVALRSIEIKKLLGDNPTVRMVLATQVNTGVPGEVLARQLAYVTEFHGPPSKFFYGAATAPYGSPGRDPLDPLGRRWLTERSDLTVDMVCSALLAKAPLHAATPGQVACHELARKYGLVSLGYELGLDLQAFKTCVDVKSASQYDPRAGQAFEAYLNRWFDAGGQQGCILQSHGGYGAGGYWGVKEDLAATTTPKLDAARRVAERVRN
jgi:hypothetical protein